MLLSKPRWSWSKHVTKRWKTSFYLKSFLPRLSLRLLKMSNNFPSVLRLDVEVSCSPSPTGFICSKLWLTYLRWPCISSIDRSKLFAVSLWNQKTCKDTPSASRKSLLRPKLTRQRSRDWFLRSADALLNNLLLLSKSSRKKRTPTSTMPWCKPPKKSNRDLFRKMLSFLAPLPLRLLKSKPFNSAWLWRARRPRLNSKSIWLSNKSKSLSKPRNKSWISRRTSALMSSSANTESKKTT